MSSARTRGISRCEEAASSVAPEPRSGFSRPGSRSCHSSPSSPNVSFNWVNLPRGRLHPARRFDTGQLQLLATILLERADPVQHQQRHLQHEFSTALGVRPRKRDLRRVHGRARHGRIRSILPAVEPRSGDQGEPAPPSLTKVGVSRPFGSAERNDAPGEPLSGPGGEEDSFQLLAGSSSSRLRDVARRSRSAPSSHDSPRTRFAHAFGPCLAGGPVS